jgi:hypothetical protein
VINENPIHKTIGNWKVHITGDISNDIECFEITFDRLTEQNWFLFAVGVGWGMDFIEAYFEAAQVIGLDTVTFQLNHQ